MIEIRTEEIEMRIYQFDDIRIENGDPDEIEHIMNVIKTFSNRIEELNREEP